MARTASTTQLPLPSLIRASAWDAGNSSMRAAGRAKWSRKDYNAAACFQNKMVAAVYGEGPEGCINFALAEQLERMRIIHIGQSLKQFADTFRAAMQQYRSQVVA